MTHTPQSNSVEAIIKSTRFYKEGGSCFECCDYEGMVEDLRAVLHSHTQAVAQDILRRSDELEVLCSKDGDKGTHQWRMFKHFRNKIVDTYIKSNPTNHE